MPAVRKYIPRLPGKVCAELFSCYRAKGVSALHLSSQTSAPRPTVCCLFWSAAVMVLLLPFPSFPSIVQASPSSRYLPCPWSLFISLAVRGTGTAKLCCIGCATSTTMDSEMIHLVLRERNCQRRQKNIFRTSQQCFWSHIYTKPMSTQWLKPTEGSRQSTLFSVTSLQTQQSVQ